MKPLELDVNDLRYYMFDTWVVYAAEDHGNQRVKLECNLKGELRVMVSGAEKWRGGCLETAIEKFENA